MEVEMTIYQWNDISEEFKGSAIILGNGASIAFDKKFEYTSLYKEAGKYGFIDIKLKSLFKKFTTKNFEIVLYRLWQAREVLSLLKMKTDLIDENYSICRSALFRTIHKAHKYENENVSFTTKLERASKFLMQFNTVFSLNYDLIVYWVLAIGNKEGQIFKDCFVEKLNDNFNVFDFKWSYLKRPFKGQTKAILVFYPHGNLTIARLKDKNFKEFDLKICSPDSMHLDAILKIINNENFDPVFISEGDYKEKKKRIDESEYLKAIFNQGFEEIGKDLVIYGWSMSKQDKHILDRLVKLQQERMERGAAPINNIAVSVYRDGNEENFMSKASKILNPISNNISFYDSTLECWCN
jgi:hypothetical protein